MEGGDRLDGLILKEAYPTEKRNIEAAIFLVSALRISPLLEIEA
jgi:hypothetical protein